jgi:DNA-binding protein H-NS
MTSTLAALIAQKETLERQIKDAQSKAKADAVTRVRELMAHHGLTVADLAATPSKRHGLKAGTKVAPKYRDPATGTTWTGRGLKPKWLSTALEGGKMLSDFAI